MAVAVVANGVFGGLVLAPRIGEYPNHVYKSLVAIGIALLASYWIARTIRNDRPCAIAWRVGLLWLGLTVCFEFVTGHYLFGNSWARLCADYRFWEGRLWSLVLLAQLTGPPMMLALRKRGTWEGLKRRRNQWKGLIY
jgi:hypothetical protein